MLESGSYMRNILVEPDPDNPTLTVLVDTGNGPARRFKIEIVEALRASGLTAQSKRLRSEGEIDEVIPEAPYLQLAERLHLL